MQSQLGITPPAELDSKLFDMAEEKINSDENHTEAPTEKKSPALEINNPYFDSGAATPLKKRLPAFLDHFNYKDLKTLFKCSLAVWIMTLFTLINPVLSVEGQAAFFGCIVLFIAPPSGIVFIHALAGMTLLLGMALGWAWGVITMKAALATRPQAETNARLAQLGQEASRNTTNVEQASGQSAYAQVLLLDGFMLDTRVTVTYFCMLGLFIYLVARIRVAAPKFVLTQIFATISADIFLANGPLIPTFAGTLPSVLIKPAAIAVGVGIVCNVFLFPESTSHIVLDGAIETIRPLGEFIEACCLSFGHPSLNMNMRHLQTTRATVIGSYKLLQGSLEFLPLDVSMCRWNAQDIALLKKPMRQTLVAFMSLAELQMTRAELKLREEKMAEHEQVSEDGESEEIETRFGHHHLAQQLDFRKLVRHPETEDLFTKSMVALQVSSEPLLNTCREVLDAIIEALGAVNHRRWIGRLNPSECRQLHSKHALVLEKLQNDKKQFLALSSGYLLDPHSHLFDENGRLKDARSDRLLPVRGLFLGLIFEERILELANALELLFGQIVILENERTRTRLWLPTGLRHFASWVFGQDPAPQVAVMKGVQDEEDSPPRQPKRGGRREHGKKGDEADETGGEEQLAALRYHRGKSRSFLSRVLLAVVHWLGSTEGLYALRVLIVTIALGVPAVVPSSAGFYYREKGLWALIMAQVSLVTYTADFVYGFILRVAGTVAGGVIGMVCWYIGSGNGPGNPYGIAAIMALVILVLMWTRLFAPPGLLQAAILTAATVYLVVSYGWDDTHIPSYGNPGVGYSVFWRRILLVIIGFSTAAIVTFIPRPPSAGRHYRRILASTLSDFQDLYALLLTDWATRQENLNTVLGNHAVETADTLASIRGPMQLLKFEFSSDDFSAKGLTQVTSLCSTINHNIFQVFYYSSSLPDTLKQRFAILSGAFEEHFVGDFMAVLTLLEQSLRTGKPLPAVMPTPLVVRAFRAGRTDENKKLLEVVDRQDIQEDGFRKYCMVLNGFSGLLRAIDELVMVVKEELGETHVIDLERWGQSKF